MLCVMRSFWRALRAQRGCIVDATGFDDRPHAAGVVNISQRVRLQHHDVRELARFERAKRLRIWPSASAAVTVAA